MNDLQIKGNWNEVKGKLKEKYSSLVEDDALYAEGKLDQLIGRIQEKSGQSKEVIKNEMSELLS
jgi:uncharacterized protein YjbJ (UPF0337 family)